MAWPVGDGVQVKCRYSLKIRCSCPVDEAPDVYDAVFESDDLIKVEDIIDAVRAYDTVVAFQEDITRSLARKFGCRVTTVGYHSGIRTEVEAP
jgi:hypothetical protein